MVARGEIGGDQVVLALEVIIQRALGEAGLGRDLVDADAADAFIVEQRARRLDDTLAGRLGGLGIQRMYTCLLYTSDAADE